MLRGKTVIRFICFLFVEIQIFSAWAVIALCGKDPYHQPQRERKPQTSSCLYLHSLQHLIYLTYLYLACYATKTGSNSTLLLLTNPHKGVEPSRHQNSQKWTSILSQGERVLEYCVFSDFVDKPEEKKKNTWQEVNTRAAPHFKCCPRNVYLFSSPHKAFILSWQVCK